MISSRKPKNTHYKERAGFENDVSFGRLREKNQLRRRAIESRNGRTHLAILRKPNNELLFGRGVDDVSCRSQDPTEIRRATESGLMRSSEGFATECQTLVRTREFLYPKWFNARGTAARSRGGGGGSGGGGSGGGLEPASIANGPLSRRRKTRLYEILPASSGSPAHSCMVARNTRSPFHRHCTTYTVNPRGFAPPLQQCRYVL